MWGYLAIGVTAIIILRLIWMIDDWSRDWTTNHARMSTTNADPTLQPLEIDASLDDVAHMLEDWVAEQPAWRVESHESTPDRERFHLTRRTAVFQFIDDVRVELTSVPTQPDGSPQTHVEAESKSRLGKGDLGQNPRNLRELRAGILSHRRP